MATKFFTNEGNKTLLEKFNGIFEYNTDIARFDALVGYFRASGYFSDTCGIVYALRRHSRMSKLSLHCGDN